MHFSWFGIMVCQWSCVDYKDNDWVNAEETERGVRHLMGKTKEGQKVMRKRVEKMAETSKKAVEEGDSSFTALELLSNKLMM